MGSNTFSSPATANWTCPTDVFQIIVECWGGGGGGGGANAANLGGGGGGGGAYSILVNTATVPGNVYNYTVGNFGNMGVNAANGTNGAITIFRQTGTNANLCVADFGKRGLRGSSNGTGGAGGAVANCLGTTKYSGGPGATRATGVGGGGGSSAGTAANGGAGTNGTPPNGGTAPTGGGNGGTGGANASNGTGGTAPGGAGGGSGGHTVPSNGGVGTAGKIILTWQDPIYANVASTLDALTIVSTANVANAVAKFTLSASANITANAATNSTAQLTAPANKTTANFQAGKISDDTNPLPAIDLDANKYTEVEWCVAAGATVANSEVYTFRVTSNGTALDTYSANAAWTIGTLNCNGYVTQTLDALTISATANVTAAGIVGTVSQTLDAASLSSTAQVAVTGTTTQTLDALVPTATANVAIRAWLIGGGGMLDIVIPTATANVAIKASVIGGQGQLDVVIPTITGTVAVVAGVQQGLADAALSAAATVSLTGVVSQALTDATLVCTGTVATTGEIGGAVSQTLADVSSTITGTVSDSGTVTQTLGALTPTITGAVSLTGTVTQALDGVSASITATVMGSVSGTVAQTLAPLSPTITGTVSIAGAVAQTLAAVTRSITGTVGVTGTVAQTLAAVSPNITGYIGTGSAFVLSASSYITANGTANTTGQLTAPSGKTVNGYFQAGKISDDTNPLPSLDLIIDTYTELEWALRSTSSAANTADYQFRVTANGTALDTYAVTPAWKSLEAVTGTVNQTLADVTITSDGLVLSSGYGVVNQTLQGVTAEITAIHVLLADVNVTLGNVSETVLFVDGSELGGGTPTGWNVYFGRVSTIYTQVVSVAYTGITQLIYVRDIAPDIGEWYVAIRAVNADGESDLSNEVFVVVPVFTATVANPSGNASVVQTLGGVSLASIAKVQVKGTVASTLGALTPTVTATVSDQALVIQTLAAATPAITAAVAVTGAVSQTLGGASLVATAGISSGESLAEVNQTLANATLDCTGFVSDPGSRLAWVDELLADAQAAVAGEVDVVGVISQILGDSSLSATTYTRARARRNQNILVDGSEVLCRT